MHAEFRTLLVSAERNTLLFQDVITMIRRHYECSPCAFCTGAGPPLEVTNPKGSNAASCLLLAFAKRLRLDQKTTLRLYGEHYQAVLADPEGSAHANIRAFMLAGWDGVRFDDDPLRLRGPG